MIDAIRENPALGLHLAIGVLVAVLHIRQKRMASSVKQSGRLMIGVVLLLATMWPILLFAMLLNAIQQPAGSKRTTRSPDQPAADDHADERARP